jgi:nitroimidazol reductase NimA-like FMN-containing flavoprotein (pyridoxamine 5'-phosphate oxidase superfamily)
VRRGPKKGRYDQASIDGVLSRGLLAHVAFFDGRDPCCIPMLYAHFGGKLCIHGSTASRSIRALAEGAAACVTVTIVHGLVLARSAFEHSANYEAVMAFGTFERVDDEAERLAAFEAFTEKLLPGRRSTKPRPRFEPALPTTTTPLTPNARPGPESSRWSARSTRLFPRPA